MSAVERSLPERVAKVEATVEAVVKGIEEIKAEMREFRVEMRESRVEVREEIRGLRMEMHAWLKWMLGFIFSSWLTLMVSIWLKR